MTAVALTGTHLTQQTVVELIAKLECADSEKIDEAECRYTKLIQNVSPPPPSRSVCIG